MKTETPGPMDTEIEAKTTDQDHQMKTPYLYLSDKRTLYLGRLSGTISMSQAASVLFISLDEPIMLRDIKSRQQYRANSFLVPAGLKVTVEPLGSRLACLYLDTLGNDLRYLKAAVKNQHAINNNCCVYSRIAHESMIISATKQLMQTDPKADVLFANIEQCMDSLGSRHSEYHSDPRIVRAVELIKTECLEHLTVNDIARKVGLSVSRLILLFKQTTGIPIRRFRLWHRLYLTAINASQGLTMTEAALAAGFADAAHFSRTFKAILGMKPSHVFSSNQNTQTRILDNHAS